ncbi:hypothetical protein [uncultured Microbacterium sp.]|uniref:hypothetical protein n=1 Tax=uncultured Microbacterium sp. TaxID=191216 RepID=UPI00262BB8BC|nr:hypothetical protein [uncultured Microbacterium sp.]
MAYDRVRDAIAEELFGSEHAGRPVYALADRSALERIAKSARLEAHDPLEGIAQLVHASIGLEEPGAVPFSAHAAAARRQKSEPLDTPLALPLLVVLSVAAEQMHAEGGVAAHNYYARLHRLLGTSADQHKRVQSYYRRHAADLWDSLNAWLEAWEGERGIPTAYTVGGHEYIGLPLSQAVVRQHDRDGLHELFTLEGFTPGVRLSPADMSIGMEPYALATPSPLSAHLRALWRTAASRERIVDAACLELEAWSGAGSLEVTAQRAAASTRLLAFLRTFPRKSVAFGLMLPYRSDGPDIIRFTLEEEEVIVPTSVGPGGSTRLSGAEGVSAVSLLGEELAGELGDDSARPFARLPKRVAPLRWDDLQGAFVEVERLSLGEDSVVIAKADARGRVEAHLSAHARPGWKELSDLAGLPEGWLLYEHVQVVSGPSERPHFDLLPLIPRARTSLTLRGGFVLPGLLRKWSSLDPPEIVALASGAVSVTVRVYRGTRLDPGAVVLEVIAEDELNVVSLVDRSLADGEYLVTMMIDAATRPSSTALLRLRSAATPQFSVQEVDIRLVYSPDGEATWPLSAGAATWLRYVNGARVSGEIEIGSHHPESMPDYEPRVRSTATAPPGPLRVGVKVAQGSCHVTGMHRFMLPRVMPGQPSTRTVEGECSTCGLVRRFAGTPWAARRRDLNTSRPLRALTLPPVIESDEPDFQVAFDALNHVGHGSFATFERIAAQVEGSGLFADAFLRRQEVAGHIDVSRSEWFEVTEWAVNSATLVPIAENRWVLIGSRSRVLIERIRELLSDRSQLVQSVDAELARVEVVGDLPSREALFEAGVSVVGRSSALTIASALPPLSSIVAGLKAITVPSYRSAELWNTASASWQPTSSLVSPGAYRLKDFRSVYVVRSDDDIEAGLVRVGNAQLVKHVASLWVNDPLIGYHARTGSVVVPLGADLPALYGRALSLCSGRAPRELVETRLLQYPAVPRDVADVVFTRLTQ